MTKIKDRIVFITGANRGIGKALVKAALDHGAKKVYASARDTAKIDDLGDKRVVKVKLDINDRAQREAAVKQAADTQVL
ncbi:MAG: SDR family NAD(P)-dependent oxidoreductase, partial [Alphaproteobacteria bacterium]|nr:SDR family NAD(P)-dependent oxidoreductase [Alphaproteobacteria bacterium]